MFKYNALSDLKDGSLTTPLRKEGEFIVCQNENGIIVNKLISDFDFAKKVEEREFVLASDLTVEMERDLPAEEPIVVPAVVPTVVVEPEPIVVPAVVVEPEIIPIKKNDYTLPDNIRGKNIKVSVETQRF